MICSDFALIEMTSDVLPKHKIILSIATKSVLQNNKKTSTQASLLFRNIIYTLTCSPRLCACHGGLSHGLVRRMLFMTTKENVPRARGALTGTTP